MWSIHQLYLWSNLQLLLNLPLCGLYTGAGYTSEYTVFSFKLALNVEKSIDYENANVFFLFYRNRRRKRKERVGVI